MVEDYKIFKYSRQNSDGIEIYSTTIVMRGYDLICFMDTNVPHEVSEEAVSQFLEEAEQSVLKQLENYNAMGG